jgi:hypothetical protein
VKKALLIRGALEFLADTERYLWNTNPQWDAGDGEHYGLYKDADDALLILRQATFRLKRELEKLNPKT